jgi:hypothetical protein
MAGTRYDIVIEQGACLNLPLTLTDENGVAYNLVSGNAPYLTGVIYRDYDHGIQATFNYTEVNPTGGLAKMTLNSSQTKAMEDTYSSYDIFLVKADGCVDRLLYGTATISGTATPLP